MIVKNHWTNHKSIPKDLLLAKELVYDCFDFDCSQLQQESESIDYSAYRFYLNEKFICYREAKITPTKTGQFVTLWKRSRLGTIEPFDSTDLIDFVFVSVRKENFSDSLFFLKMCYLKKESFRQQPAKEKEL